MKNVLAIAPYPYLPYFSGGQKFIAQFFEYLGKEVNLVVVSVPGNDETLVNHYRLQPLLKASFSRYYDRSLIRKLSLVVKQEQVDSIICEHPYMAWLCFAVRKRTGVRVYIHTHNIEYQRFRSMGKWWWPVLKYYEKRSFKKADGIFFITPEDREFAVTKWKIDGNTCYDLPYGTNRESHPADRSLARQQVAAAHGITDEKILLFNGLLNYAPNLEALHIICEQLNPLLLAQPAFRYKIIICGKHLPEAWHKLEAYRDKHIIYAGFVEDIDAYFKAADIFLNPVQTGGGIKTKMVEAIALGTTVLATETAATGMERTVCGKKLITVADNDWKGFAEGVIQYSGSAEQTPPAFYEKYNWGNLAGELVYKLSHNLSR